MRETFDVAIIGGGPAGATCGTLLRKYDPRLRVVILERDRFPRDHVGESQLPVIGRVLDEMGVWDKVEAAGFPIKIGATYRWGRSPDLWDFEFLAGGALRPEPRPARYKGQRTQTAFQVDRAIYDKILLDHARGMGCEVREETRVISVRGERDRVLGLDLDGGGQITARHYVDASGHAGVLRRAIGVEIEQPTTLRNVAFWDYWQNADWAVEVGVGGTRVLVLSQGYGWVWFIPLGPTRTSIGLILPAEYAKASPERPAELYARALSEDPVLVRLLAGARCEGRFHTTKDWSFVAERLAGENWFLAGESAGFADPILAAGMSLAHVGARDVAYTILALERRDYEPEWLRSRYSESHRREIHSHVRFADFWYTHNGVFGDLKEYAREIAGDHGLDMSADEAWRWFGQGGFIDHDAIGTGFGGYSVIATKQVSAAFTGGEPHFEVVGKTHFRLDLEGAEKRWGAGMIDGRIERHRCYYRGGKYLPNAGLCGWLVRILKEERSFEEIGQEAARHIAASGIPEADLPNFRRSFLEVLEAMVSDGWVVARVVPGATPLPSPSMEVSAFFHPNRDVARAAALVD